MPSKRKSGDETVKRTPSGGFETYLGTSTARGQWNPLQLQDLVDGLKERKKVIVVQGEKYNIKYHDENRFWFQHATDRVPCGHSDIRRLELNLENW